MKIAATQHTGNDKYDPVEILGTKKIMVICCIRVILDPILDANKNHEPDSFLTNRKVQKLKGLFLSYTLQNILEVNIY